MSNPSILTSKSYKRAETNLRDKLTASYLKHYPHCMIPGYNLHNESLVEDWDVENIVDQHHEYPYHCDLPRPLLPPARLPRSVIGEQDPALQLLSIKSHMKDDIERIKQYYKKHEKELDIMNRKKVKWSQKSGKTTSIPRYLADIAEIMEMDPDPHFEGAYNWYYTGGTLKYINHSGSNILLFPFMGELVAVPIHELEDFMWKPSLANAGKHKLDSLLYELRHSALSNSYQILGRCKYRCNFYLLSEKKNKFSLFQIHEHKTEIPFVGADLSPINQHQFCTLNVKREVALCDMTRTKRISSSTVMETKVLSDSWGSLEFQVTDPNSIIFVDRCCIHYLDVRLPLNQPVLTMCPKYCLESCERLSVDFPSRLNSCRYIGSYHSLLMCDSRSPKDCVQQKWTHQFESIPIMGSVINRQDNEFIVLSSQLAGESSIILNTWFSEASAFSYNFPYTPPCIKETLDESQKQGLALDPHLRSRLNLSNVGSVIVPNKMGDLFTFSQNSIGDIFYQCITHENCHDKYSPVNCKSFCILNAWENAISKQPQTIVPLTVSHKASMEHVFKNFTNRKLRLKEKESMPDDSFDPSWKISIDKLSSYVDILAPELLAVWDVCEEVSLPSTAPPHQKVLNWLETAADKGLSQTQEESMDISITVNTQELISVSQQEPDITCLDDSNVLQELFLPKVRSKSIKKKRNIQK